MDKNKLIELKRKLIAIGLLGVMIGTTGCGKDENGVPKRSEISRSYYNFDEYTKYIVKNKEVEKVYKMQNIILLCNKETYEVKEYIFDETLFGYFGGQLYELDTEDLIVYSDGIGPTYNEKYYRYLMKNNYIIKFTNLSDLIENKELKEYYTLDEIKELEPEIIEGLKLINKEKAKTLAK